MFGEQTFAQSRTCFSLENVDLFFVDLLKTLPEADRAKLDSFRVVIRREILISCFAHGFDFSAKEYQ